MYVLNHILVLNGTSDNSKRAREDALISNNKENLVYCNLERL